MNKIIVGIDEVGRGPLAGPMVLFGVAFGENFNNDIKLELNDSKKLSPKKRDEISKKLNATDIFYCIQENSAKDIDEFGISYCMKKSVQAIENHFISIFNDKSPYFILDGNVNYLTKKGEAMIKADEKIHECMAASILAKHYRDSIMTELSNVYQQYGFERNMGYGTREHYSAIQQFNICSIHRKTFLKKILKIE